MAANNPSTFIITPTPRLARAQRHALASKAATSGQTSWATSQVLAFGQWITQLIQEAYVADAIEPIPISGTQSRGLWRSVIDHQIFIGEPRVAEMAQASWRLIHEFQLPEPRRWSDTGLSVDQRQFKAWAGAYVSICDRRGMADEWALAARLPELIRDRALPLPERIELTGFELPMPPLQKSFIEAAGAVGVEVIPSQPPEAEALAPEIQAFPDTVAELRAAAAWARSQIEQDPEARLAVVVPRLQDHLSDVERVFRQTFDPAAAALDSATTPAWHCSLGPALRSWALVADALACLQLDPERLDQTQAEVFWQSPYLGDADEEALARARARQLVWRQQPWWTNAGQLSKYAARAGASKLSTRLREWRTLWRTHRSRALPSQWIERFQEELKTLGFGRGRSLASREYQTLQRFHELLEDFSTLDLVHDAPMSRGEALKRLREMAGDSKFRERNPGAAVEILGVEEALGSSFDAAWVLGLDDQVWPGNSRRDPFIPHYLQAPLPSASPAACLARSRAELQALAWIAPERVGSFARGSDDVPLARTHLLASIPVTEHASTEPTEAAPMEWIDEDAQGPALEASELKGGTRVLQDQADCPFRAFARHRLRAETPLPPSPGLDALTRGSLIHKVLERFWTGLPDQAALRALSEADRTARIGECIEASLTELLNHNPLLMTPTERALEAVCLKRSVDHWLAIELDREPFAVKALEQPVELAFAGLRLTGKIDRIDTIEDQELILDYKTGRTGSADWFPDPRIKELQLPAYVAPRHPAPAGLAFARLRADDMGFDGLAEASLGVPGMKVIGTIKSQSKFKGYEDWEQLRADWHLALEQLAEGMLEGQAAVDPRDNNACNRCDLEALCRINDQARYLEADDE
jgi:probable DNA repair protein